MSCDFDAVEPDRTVYRLGRTPDPWAWPDWSRAAPDGTFGNRWDDPDGEFRVLYAASERVGAFVETLARFRPDLQLLAELDAIDGTADALPAGTIPREWLDVRRLGVARLGGRFAIAGTARSLATVRAALASSAIRHGLAEIDASTIRVVAPRAFTQDVSRHIFECADADGRPFDGICYRSRLGDEFENWAVFESVPPDEAPLAGARAERVVVSDPDLQHAIALLGLRID